MPRIPEPEIERLKSEVSVERLVAASGIELKKSGKEKLSGTPSAAPSSRKAQIVEIRQSLIGNSGRVTRRLEPRTLTRTNVSTVA